MHATLNFQPKSLAQALLSFLKYSREKDMRPTPAQRPLIIALALCLLATLPARAAETSVWDETFPPRERAPLGILGWGAQASIGGSETVLAWLLAKGRRSEAEQDAFWFNKFVEQEAVSRLRKEKPQYRLALNDLFRRPDAPVSRVEAFLELPPSSFPQRQIEAQDLVRLVEREKQTIVEDLRLGRPVTPELHVALDQLNHRSRRWLHPKYAFTAASALLALDVSLRLGALAAARNPGYVPVANLAVEGISSASAGELVPPAFDDSFAGPGVNRSTQEE